MNQHEMLAARLRECAQTCGCGACRYSYDGCSHYKILMAAAETLESYIHPESSGLYDIEEVHDNCRVEVWKNSVTGEVSVGWYESEED